MSEQPIVNLRTALGAAFNVPLDSREEDLMGVRVRVSCDEFAFFSTIKSTSAGIVTDGSIRLKLVIDPAYVDAVVKERKLDWLEIAQVERETGRESLGTQQTMHPYEVRYLLFDTKSKEWRALLVLAPEPNLLLVNSLGALVAAGLMKQDQIPEPWQKAICPTFIEKVVSVSVIPT